MQDMIKAKGHVAKVFLFDTETAMLPLNINEGRRLHFFYHESRAKGETQCLTTS